MRGALHLMPDMTSRTRRITVLGIATLLALPLATAAPNDAKQAPAQADAFTFGGTRYVHRWSQKGQNEFTPPNDADLARWHDMVTINVHEGVRSGEDLAAVANAVLGNYQRFGRIVRTDSKPRTAEHPAEHLVVALLGDPGFLEAVFARFVLVDGGGVVIVYSHRVYGSTAAEAAREWLEANGPAVERALMTWNGLPSVAALKRLPQTR